MNVVTLDRRNTFGKGFTLRKRRGRRIRRPYVGSFPRMGHCAAGPHRYRLATMRWARTADRTGCPVVTQALPTAAPARIPGQCDRQDSGVAVVNFTASARE
jgi:hypothetical protein